MAKKKKKKGLDPLLLIVIIFIGFIGLIILPKIISNNTVAMPKDRTHPQTNFNKMGDQDAPISVVIYSDFQCSHCANFYNGAEQDLIDEYVKTGLINYEFSSFGNSMGPESAQAAEAAYCAGDQDLFWDYHNVLYENFSYGNSGGYDEDNLIKFAKKLGMDTNSFEACLTDGKYESKVNEDLETGKALGVSGTPSILVNDVVTFPGNVSIEDIRSVLDEMIIKAE